MAQQTAVEWLQEQIKLSVFVDRSQGFTYLDTEILFEMLAKAKQMEKEQMVQLYLTGSNPVLTSKTNNMTQETTINSASSSTVTVNGWYSSPELIATVVLQDCIKLVYKRRSLISNGSGMPDPEIYAEVYSRTDGTMRIVKGAQLTLNEIRQLAERMWEGCHGCDETDKQKCLS